MFHFSAGCPFRSGIHSTLQAKLAAFIESDRPGRARTVENVLEGTGAVMMAISESTQSRSSKVPTLGLVVLG